MERPGQPASRFYVSNGCIGFLIRIAPLGVIAHLAGRDVWELRFGPATLAIYRSTTTKKEIRRQRLPDRQVDAIRSFPMHPFRHRTWMPARTLAQGSTAPPKCAKLANTQFNGRGPRTAGEKGPKPRRYGRNFRPHACLNPYTKLQQRKCWGLSCPRRNHEWLIK
jgi:hypothetical protein